MVKGVFLTWYKLPHRIKYSSIISFCAMKSLIEYCKAAGSLMFGLMVWVWAVLIAVPDYQEKLPLLAAQTVDQSDISVNLELSNSNPPQLFSWTSVRYTLELTNTQVQDAGESYPNVDVRIELSDWLLFESLSQDVVVLATPGSEQWNTITFQYRDPFQVWETNRFTFDVLATQAWNQTVTIEVSHPSDSNESTPYESWCSSWSNNVACSTLLIEDDLQPECSSSLDTQSLYEDWTLSDNSLRTLPACEVWNFGSPSPAPWDSDAPDTEFTFNCVLIGKPPVSCSVSRRFCGDFTIDWDHNEACDGSDINGLACDMETCQLVWCTDSWAYNYQSDATQDNGECKVMWDGIVDFRDWEMCDDWNILWWDGCSSVWQIESGYTCPLAWQPCEDIDECEESSPCGSNSVCSNTIGSFSCSCESGYSSPDGTDCVDIDECSAWTDSCDTNATCNNTDGWFVCGCNPWYQWDWETCNDIDECADGTDSCDANGMCSNTPWWYDCSCNVWYYNQANTVWSPTVNTCLEIDECTWQVADWNWWYTSIQDSSTLNQWDECTVLGWICSNEIGWNPWFRCDCPEGYQADGQWVCQVVYGDNIIVPWIETCDTWILGSDDGCSDTWQLEVPSCSLWISPTTWSIWTIHELTLESPLSAWESLVLVERWDGTIIEAPMLPQSHSYTAWQQYTITATVANRLDDTILWSCETVVAIDTVCGNEIQEPWEACDAWTMNDVLCNAGYGETCEYCTSSCVMATASWASCGDGVVDEWIEACDDWIANWQLCTWASWSVCEYCSESCEIKQHTLPSKWGTSSSISVSVKATSSGIVSEKTHDAAQDAYSSEDSAVMSNDSELPIQDTKEKTTADVQDTEFVSWVIDALLPSNSLSSNTSSTTITPVSLDELFMQPVWVLTSESLSQVLTAINASTKDEIRNALQRYIEMKK